VGYKILLADDSVTVQKIITLTFSDEGVDVVTVNNGDEAISSLQYLRPALVMADVSIPGKNGYEICDYIKKHPDLKNTPVILLVPAFEPFDEKRAASVGADHHLTKPFQSIRTLISTVKGLIEPGPDGSVTKRGESKRSSSPGVVFTSDVLDLNDSAIEGRQSRIKTEVLSSGSEKMPDESISYTAPFTTESNPGEEADHVLELDDVLSDTWMSRTAPGNRLAAGKVVSPVETRIAAESASTFDGAPISSSSIPQGVIDEIADRVATKIIEKLPEILSREMTSHVLPEIVEIVKRQHISGRVLYQEADSLLELDEV